GSGTGRGDQLPDGKISRSRSELGKSGRDEPRTELRRRSARQFGASTRTLSRDWRFTAPLRMQGRAFGIESLSNNRPVMDQLIYNPAHRTTTLPQYPPIGEEEKPPNTARDVQKFVGGVMSIALMPVDMYHLGVAKLTQGLSDALPSFPAARLYVDLVLGWPHSHPHPPTFGFPLPSIGPVLAAGSRNVLINGLPAA